jgi:glutamine amidotransferase
MNHPSMITVIDYGVGNLASIQNMLRRLGHPAVISADPAIVAAADKLILPGVGAFDYGMARLRDSGMMEALNHTVIERRTPILGICLGAQLLTHRSDEGELPGLGWFDAETVSFDHSKHAHGERIPHMGWADLEIIRPHPLLTDLPEEPRFYFVHSFHLKCRHEEEIIATAHHGYSFAAGIARGHIAGVQFHPEKSHKFGMKVLDNFAKWQPGTLA